MGSIHGNRYPDPRCRCGRRHRCDRHAQRDRQAVGGGPRRRGGGARRLAAGAARQSRPADPRDVSGARLAGAQRQSPVVLRPREDVIRSVSTTDRRHAEACGRAARRCRARAYPVVRPSLRTDCRARIVSDDAGKCTPNAGRPRPLGRAAAPACRRVGGDAATLRFRRTAGSVLREWPPTTRSHRPLAGRQADRRGREGPARAIPRSADRGRRGVSCRASAGSRAPGARPHGPARRQGVLGSAGELARDGRDVSSRRVAVQRGTAARSDVDRARPPAARAARQPADTDRAADHRRAFVATGSVDRELSRSRPSRA